MIEGSWEFTVTVVEIEAFALLDSGNEPSVLCDECENLTAAIHVFVVGNDV